MFDNLPAQRPDFAAALADLKHDAGGAPSGEYLKMNRHTGEWEHGMGQTPLGDALVAVNPSSFQRGWIAWEGGSKVGEVMAPLTEPRPACPDQPGDWTVQLGVDMARMDDQTQLQFKSNSQGGKQFIAELAEAIRERTETGDDAIVPVLELNHTSYQHRQYGRINKPSFEIVEWRTIDDVSEAEPAEADVAPEPVKRTRTRRRK